MSQKITEELCLIALKIDGKLEGKLTCAFKNNLRNLANFHWLKNSSFVLESEIAELNLNKNSKGPDRPDEMWQLYFTFDIDD